MPECGIGLIPDVGGSLLLARAPGRIGEYLGTTGSRMGAADAIYSGFADCYVPEADWPTLIADLERSGDVGYIAASTAKTGTLEAMQNDIDRHFGGDSALEIFQSLQQDADAFATNNQTVLRRQSPISTACTIELIHHSRAANRIEDALKAEYRFTCRAAEHGDFMEGVRAAIIDKDKSPNWRHTDLSAVTQDEIDQMLAPLGANELNI